MLIGYLLLINASGFALMHSDKQKARKNKWRIPESTLLTIAALGGSLGIYAGMYAFRHKTRHAKFSVGVPILLSIHILAGILIFLNIRN